MLSIVTPMVVLFSLRVIRHRNYTKISQLVAKCFDSTLLLLIGCNLSFSDKILGVERLLAINFSMCFSI